MTFQQDVQTTLNLLEEEIDYLTKEVERNTGLGFHDEESQELVVLLESLKQTHKFIQRYKV